MIRERKDLPAGTSRPAAPGKRRFRRLRRILVCLLLLCAGGALGWAGARLFPSVRLLPSAWAVTVPVPSVESSPAPAEILSPETPPQEETPDADETPLPIESAPPAETAAGETGPVSDPGEDSWMLALINFENLLPEDYQVPELTQLKNNQSIDSRVYPYLQEMMDAARAAGYEPLICSSFRTWDKQSSLFERKVAYYMDQGSDRETAEQQAAVWVARPGTSEHQAGLAVDIVSLDYQVLDEGQEDTPLQQWLMEHCWEYGFILRYPSGKSDLTGVGYEPWHYRYVGREAAQAITEQGLCLEEYLAGSGA